MPGHLALGPDVIDRRDVGRLVERAALDAGPVGDRPRPRATAASRSPGLSDIPHIPSKFVEIVPVVPQNLNSGVVFA